MGDDGLTHSKDDRKATRERILKWFDQHARALGDLYRGAVKILDEPGFPGQLRFVAHAVREIRNRLPDVVTGVKSGGTLKYQDRLDEVAKVWRAHGFQQVSSSDTEPSLVPPDGLVRVPVPVHQAWVELVLDHEQVHVKRREQAARLFEGLADENKGRREVLRPTVDQWFKETKWCEKRVHHGRDSAMDPAELAVRFNQFEDALHAILGGFFPPMEVLDEILEDANS